MIQDTHIASAWSRFSAYEVRDGYVRPAPGAALVSYDPWALYGRSRRGRAVAPYQTLLSLLDQIEFRPIARRGVRALTPEGERLIAAWCAAHGLLGLLPHRTTMAAIPMESVAGHRRSELVEYYVRAPAGWQRTTLRDRMFADFALTDNPLRAHSRGAETRDIPRAHAIVSDLRQGFLYEEPLHQTWGRFFPDAPPAYPLPLTPEFWHVYAEPVEDFLDGALALREALAMLGSYDGDEPSSPDDPAPDDARPLGIRQLNALVAPVGTSLIWREQGYEQRSAVASLLATFALMALQDLAAGFRPRHCVVCSGLFVSATPTAVYCSTRCRYTAQKRTQRARTRQGARTTSRDTPTRSSTRTATITPKE